jgi:hypothetical protein
LALESVDDSLLGDESYFIYFISDRWGEDKDFKQTVVLYSNILFIGGVSDIFGGGESN